jgi:hypothetical protein
MTNKFNNPAANVLAARQAKAQGVDIDPRTTDSNMLSQSALHVENATNCPKCGNATTSASLAGGIPARFCPDCSVTMPVPMGE